MHSPVREEDSKHINKLNVHCGQGFKGKETAGADNAGWVGEGLDRAVNGNISKEKPKKMLGKRVLG